MQIASDGDGARPRDQQPEGQRLRIAIGKLLVAGLGEEQAAPVVGQRGQRLGLALQRLDHLVTQQAAKPGTDFGQRLGRTRRDGLPLQEIPEQRQQTRPRHQCRASGLDVTLQAHHGGHQFAVVPEAELVAIAVEQVGQGLQPLPLGLVVRVLEAARVSAFARRLQLDEADQRAVHGGGVVGPGAQIGDGTLAHRDHDALAKTAQRRQVVEQAFERAADLVFRLADRHRIPELGLGRRAERGHRRFNRLFFHVAPWICG